MRSTITLAALGLALAVAGCSSATPTQLAAASDGQVFVAFWWDDDEHVSAYACNGALGHEADATVSALFLRGTATFDQKTIHLESGGDEFTVDQKSRGDFAPSVGDAVTFALEDATGDAGLHHEHTDDGDIVWIKLNNGEVRGSFGGFGANFASPRFGGSLAGATP